MATVIEKTGKTIEDAINAAVAELGVEKIFRFIRRNARQNSRYRQSC